MAIKPLICIAGASGPVYERLCKKRYFPNKGEEINCKEAKYASFTGNKKNPPIIHELENRGGTICYKKDASDAFLDDLVKRLVGDCSDEQVGIGLVYVNYTGSGNFIEKFYPFAITVPIDPFYPSTWQKNCERKEAKEIVKQLTDAAEFVRKRIRMMSNAVAGTKFSPFLLPLANFKSEILREGIRSIFDQIGKADFDSNFIKEISEKICAAHLKEQNPARKFFEDQRSLQFKNPGSANHGEMNEVINGHSNRCLINSRVRLGASIKKGFHYDCSYERRKIEGNYINCHADTINISSRKEGYINISPSDSIREENPTDEAKKIRRRNRKLKYRKKKKTDK